MMTPDQIIEVVQAFKDGKRIQDQIANSSGPWHDITGSPCWNFYSFNYRIAPSPVLRPWRPEEAIGKTIREINRPLPSLLYIVHSVSGHAAYFTANENCRATFADLKDKFETTPDNGKTWLPCGVMEK